MFFNFWVFSKFFIVLLVVVILIFKHNIGFFCPDHLKGSQMHNTCHTIDATAVLPRGLCTCLWGQIPECAVSVCV